MSGKFLKQEILHLLWYKKSKKISEKQTCSWSGRIEISLFHCKVNPFPDIINSGFSSPDNSSPSPLNLMKIDKFPL